MLELLRQHDLLSVARPIATRCTSCISSLGELLRLGEKRNAFVVDIEADTAAARDLEAMAEQSKARNIGHGVYVVLLCERLYEPD